MAAAMLAAYYDHSCDSRSLFADLEIANDPSFEQHLNRYPVIYLDITGFTTRYHDDNIVMNNSCRPPSTATRGVEAAHDERLRVGEQRSGMLASGKGFADIVLIPRKNTDSPAIILELKVNKDADSAIDQIHRKQYPAKVAEYADRLLLVGINYDRETKQHTCRIEK